MLATAAASLYADFGRYIPISWLENVLPAEPRSSYRLRYRNMLLLSGTGDDRRL
ncbi:hypothetical protein HSEST_0678 [Halapricum desulfuricans]|uniref:Uncharacterized protein n=1 Tax=Halapricum desulfuricans TaxID=2841257 RepID=A0A897NTV6_9EURY|nr:hypothetical protein HSEST_0678 [Halapricum desulfuricans]